jgi:hypothetical protein
MASWVRAVGWDDDDDSSQDDLGASAGGVVRATVNFR